MRLLLFLLLFVSAGQCLVVAQTIHGEVLDMETKQPVEGVSIENIYTSLVITTGSSGGFLIAAKCGELLEFRKDGYKLTRVRIPQGFIPPFFRIIISRGIPDIKVNDIAGNRYNYHNDSLKYRTMYKSVLDFPKMSTFDMIASPFTALSRHNQQAWRFQEEYERFEKEKFVDRTFNETLITRLTGLTDDSLHTFMRRYRPSYEQVRAMGDYAFFNYIRNGAHHFRSIVTPRFSR